MGFNRGISANTKLPPGNKSSGLGVIEQVMSRIKGGIQIGRVTDIILNQNYPNIKKYGGTSAIGTIFYESNVDSASNKIKQKIAKPLFPQMSSYPLINELVLIFQLTENKPGFATNLQETQYYMNIIGLWNHPHHNAYPNPKTSVSVPNSQQKTYEQVSAGSISKTSTESNNFIFDSPLNPSQNTFIERSNIHPLLPFTGDIIYQGRWGNSIRFSSTTKPTNSNSLNNWSEVGNNGDPITIIRNGQGPNVSPQGWVHITENINDDLSSIYLTSAQKLNNFRVAGNENYGAFPSSFKLTPPSLYTNSQIAINSNRVVINAKEDSILLSAKNALSVSVENSVGITTPAFYVGSNKVRLGGSDAKEPILKGNITVSLLKSLVESVEKLAQILEVEKNWPQGALVTSNNTVATNVKTTLQDLLNQLDLDESKSDSLKSYTSKVK